jgi:prepilin-type N-terminal cleavage/methylation domain-containing protein
MKSGFTLVEILIVVIILGILAAIVVPQFSEATGDSEQVALDSNASQIQKQIDLYTLQHNGRGPHLNHAGQINAALFGDRLTNRTDIFGKITDDGAYGPYLSSWPSNPRITNPALTDQVQVDGIAGRGQYGWYYNSSMNIFIPGDSESVAKAMEERGMTPPPGRLSR